MEVRAATVDDERTIWNLLMEHFYECAFHELDRNKSYQTLHDVVVRGSALVLVDQGKVVGSMGLDVFEPWWTHNKKVQDVWVNISPDFRSLAAFKALVDRAIAFASEHDAELFLCLNGTKDTGRKRVLYKRYMDELCQVYQINYAGGRFAVEQ